MLKRLILALSITLFAIPAIGADMLRVPGFVPMPQPAPIKYDLAIHHVEGTQLAALHSQAIAQNVNPDPFRTQVQNQPAQQNNPPSSSSPFVVPTPVIDTNPGPLSWIWTIIGGVAAAAFGGNTINNFRKTSSGVPREEIKNVAEQAALRVLDSGIPGQLVQGLANRVPILGGIVEQLRPIIREELRERLGGAPVPTSNPAPLSADDQLLRSIEALIENRFKAMETRLEQRFGKGAVA